MPARKRQLVGDCETPVSKKRKQGNGEGVNEANVQAFRNSIAPSEQKPRERHIQVRHTTKKLKTRGKEQIDKELATIKDKQGCENLDGVVAYVTSCARFDKNQGTGAMKYSPVDNVKAVDIEECEKLRKRRAGTRSRLSFTTLLEPQSQAGKKMMVVPSIGCPERFTDEAFVTGLLWGQRSTARQTVLMVHESEAKTYEKEIGDTLKKLGVGLVAWKEEKGVLGFGISRLAAQLYGYSDTVEDVILCDHNVLAGNKDQKAGYETEAETTKKGGPKKIKKKKLYWSIGPGTGITTYHLNANQMPEKTQGVSAGGAGRPVEQVVIVNKRMSYDPCCITGSEDMEMTHEVLSLSTHHKPSVTQYRGPKTINKTETGANLSTMYQQMWKANQEQLYEGGEKEVEIMYFTDGECHRTTVGALSAEIVNKYPNLEKTKISSLIIDKILLAHKATVYHNPSRRGVRTRPKEVKDIPKNPGDDKIGWSDSDTDQEMSYKSETETDEE